MGVIIKGRHQGAHAVMHKGVLHDSITPHGILFHGRQMAVYQEMSDLQKGRLFRQFLNFVPAVLQEALIAVNVAD